MSDQEVVAALQSGQLCLVSDTDTDVTYAYADTLERDHNIKIERMLVLGEGVILWIKDAVTQQPLDKFLLRSRS